jgi:predicted phage tail protein
MGKLFGRVHKIDAPTGSVAEVVRYLRANFPGIDEYLMRAKSRDGVGFAIFRGKENLSKDQLTEPCHGYDIRIAPVILGAKKNGIVNIIVGAVIIIVGVVYGVYTEDWATAGKIIYFGATVAVGGLIQMLTPRPKTLGTGDNPDNQASYSFNGPVNTQAQGNPVPVLYGKMWVGSAVVSAGMDVKDDVLVPTSGVTGGPGGGMGKFHNGVRTVAQ